MQFHTGKYFICNYVYFISAICSQENARELRQAGVGLTGLVWFRIGTSGELL
jgi:hypothetical protein